MVKKASLFTCTYILTIFIQCSIRVTGFMVHHKHPYTSIHLTIRIATIVNCVISFQIHWTGNLRLYVKCNSSIMQHKIQMKVRVSILFQN
jgi:hypothetical protein